jgi:hypothetical protein
MVAAAVQWAKRIIRKMDGVFPAFHLDVSHFRKFAQVPVDMLAGCW